MTAIVSRPAPAQASGELSHRQILTILSGLMLGMFLASLDQTIVSTAIKTIGNDLHGLSAQAWVTTAFLITLDDRRAAVRQAVGHLRPQAAVHARDRDLRGRLGAVRPGHSRCTSSPRSARSRASAPAASCRWPWRSWATSSRPGERARYQGYMMAVFASSSVLGPVLGGLLVRREQRSSASPAGAGSSTSTSRRGRRARRRRPGAADRLRAPRAAGRLGRRGRARGRSRAAARRGRAGPRLGLGLGRSVPLLRRRRGRPGRRSSGFSTGWATTR